MACGRVVVVDDERAVAEVLAAALGAALGDVAVSAGEPAGAAPLEGDAVVVATWPRAPAAARLVLLLAATASPEDARAAESLHPNALVSRGEPFALTVDAVRLVVAGAGLVSPAVQRLLAVPGAAPARFTAAEHRLLAELANRPDTRSRVAHRLGITTSTVDNQVASIKRKVLATLLTSGNAPADGYLSMEALIGWATRQSFTQKS